jgi:hypothetical protein
MSTLTPDFARTITESTRRAALFVNEEIERIEGLYARVVNGRETATERQTLQRRTEREAAAATDGVVAEARELNELWNAAVGSLREGLSLEEQIAVLESFLDLAGSLGALTESVSRFWELVNQMGSNAEGAADLSDARRVFDRVRSEAARALQARRAPWQPSDPARLERGRRETEEGKRLSPDQARAFFRAH